MEASPSAASVLRAGTLGTWRETCRTPSMTSWPRTGAMEQAQAVDYVKKLMTKGRYSLDVWRPRPPTTLHPLMPYIM